MDFGDHRCLFHREHALNGIENALKGFESREENARFSDFSIQKNALRMRFSELKNAVSGIANAFVHPKTKSFWWTKNDFSSQNFHNF